MKILSISSLFPYPSMQSHGVFVKNRLEALSKLGGNEIHVISPVASSIFHRFFKRYRPQLNAPEAMTLPSGLDVHYPRFVSLPGVAKFVELISAKRNIVSYIEKKFDVNSFDVIDVHWGFPDLIIGSQLAKKYNKPMVFTLRGMETFYDGDSRNKHVLKAMSDVSAFISLSNEMGDYVVSKGASSPVHVIPNGADTARFTYIEKSIARKKLGLSQDKVYLLGVGSLIRRKGFQFLISALYSMPSNVELLIAGKSGLEGDYEIELKRLVSKFGLTGFVHFIGPQTHDELANYYNAVDAFCLSSFGEGSPNVLMEAACCGCPVIAHDVGESKFVLDTAGAGVLLQNPNLANEADMIAQWKKSLSDLISSKVSDADRKKQSEYLASFDWSWCASQVNDVFVNLVKG